MNKVKVITSCPKCNPDEESELKCNSCGTFYRLHEVPFMESQIEERHDSSQEYWHKNTKPLLEWCEDYMLGIKEIDEQHKSIVDIINEVHIAIQQGTRNHKFITEILKRLDIFVRDHFSYEEKLFQAANYDEMEQQKKEHRIFSRQVKELHDEFAEEFFDLRSVLKFMVGWFLEHTQGSDRRFVEFWKTKVKDK